MGLRLELSTGVIEPAVSWFVGLKLAFTVGKNFALLSIHRLPRRAQVGHRRLQRGIVAERLLHQGIERRRSKQRPPLGGNIAPDRKVLRLALRCIGGRRSAAPAAPWCSRPELPGSSGVQKIRPDRAACQKQRGCGERQPSRRLS